MDENKVTALQAVKIALEKGYHVDDAGVVRSPRKILKLSLDNRGYSIFSVFIRGRNIPVKVHKMVAYLKYGDAAFDGYRMVVRHLNGIKTDNSRSNIAIGTLSDNQLDIPPHKRSETIRKVHMTMIRKHGLPINISLNRNNFKVDIKRPGIRVNRTFLTLDEAIEFRDAILSIKGI